MSMSQMLPVAAETLIEASPWLCMFCTAHVGFARDKLLFCTRKL